MPKNLLKLIVAISLCEGVGILGSFFTVNSIEAWYQLLNKPFFSPPNWIFGPVWTTLYALMGVSLYLIWQKGLKRKGVKEAIFIFGIHLALNASWSIVFFGLRSPFYAFINILLLLLFIILFFIKFIKIDKRTGYLLLPYITWVSFAAVLNYYIWKLN